VASQYRRLLATNVAELMRLNPELDSWAKLAKKCSTPTRKLGASTIGHLLNADDGPQPQLDTVVAVAEAFKVAPWMLLHPEFDAATKSIGELDAAVLEIARRISGMPKESQHAVLELFKHSSPAAQREPLARVREQQLHEPPSDYKVRRPVKKR
jgi:hypothetical protein